MNLPVTRDELRQRWEAGERFEFYFFYGHHPPPSGVDASCLSQWFVRVFEVDGVGYPTAEHWMMAEKARLFGDDAMLTEILASEGPREAKAFGRKVSGFDNEIWGQHRFQIVCRGNLAKFGQHEDLKQFLLGTANIQAAPDYRAVAEQEETYEQNSGEEVRERLGIYKVNADGDDGEKQTPLATANVILVEAAPRDTIWGIGLGQKNPKARDPFTWRGRNLLGFALTCVREQLREESSTSNP